jgi:hypothetical protein
VCAAVPPLPQYVFMARNLVKHRDFTFLLCTLNENRPLKRLMHRWEDNFRTDLREIGWKIMDWIHLARDGHRLRALLNTAMNVQIP